MLCCKYCFKDKILKKIVEESGDKGNCDFCKSKNAFCISPEGLGKYFLPLTNLYTPSEIPPNSNISENHQPKYLYQKLQEDWSIFNDNDMLSQNELLESILLKQIENGEIDLFGSYHETPNNLIEEASESELEWRQFNTEMKSHNRFFPTIKINLDELLYLLQHIDDKIDANTVVFRSRMSTGAKKYPPLQMGMPPANKAKSGRANPIGIPYLYLASSIQTAISEIRPNITDTVTVGRFKLIDTIRIIDFREVSPFQFVESEDFEYCISKIGYLKKIGEDLSKAVSQKDAELEYLPTQYLCEFIKNNDWDGVAYESSLSDGYNLAIFSDEKVKCYKTELYGIGKTDISYTKII